MSPRRRAPRRRGPPVAAWWGDGPPPWERWPGASLRLDDAGGRYHFDAAAADQACEFFPTYLRHVKGDFAGQPFELLPWQRDLIVRPLFGWKRADGTRRFRKAFLEVGKKNGKSGLASGVGLFLAFGDDEPGAEVYCLDPATRVLFADLMWRPVGDATGGDRLVAFDEEPLQPGGFRKLRTATVDSAVRIVLPCYRIRVEDGRTVVASADHRWLGMPYPRGQLKGWVRTADLRPGSRIRDLGQPWEPSSSWEAGYLAGVFDGEGSFHNAPDRAGFRIAFSQKPGAVMALTRGLLDEADFDISAVRDHASGVQTFEVRSLYDCLRHLGELRPRRLLQKAPQWWEGKAPSRCGYATVESVEYVGDRQVVALGTSTKTLFAEGLFSHNSVAADRDQARIVFGDAAVMARENPKFLKDADITVLRNAIVQTATNSTFKAVSSEVGTKHGFNVHGLIFDEFHTQRTRDLYDTLYKGTSARRQPVVFLITTAGDDRESICYEEYEYAKKVRDGVIEDEQYLPVIFESDPEADWTDERTWHASNPSLGVTKFVEYMRAECAAAQAEPRKRNSFLRLELNIWTESRTVWIAPEAWEACRRTEPAEDLAGLPCCAGMDLSASADLTAVVLAFRRRDRARPAETLVVELPPGAATTPPAAGPAAPTSTAPTPKVEHRLVLDYEVELVPYFFLPREVLHERARKDRVPYDVWAREGWLRVTEGNVVDYAEVYRFLLEEVRPRFKGLAQVGYDPWNANHLASSLAAAGVQMVEVRQGYASLSGPSKLFEALVRSRRIRHDGNPVMRYCVANCEVASDPAGNIKPVKPGGIAQGTRRIDGVVAAVTALSRLMVHPDRSASPYAHRGVRVVG